jgi:Amt family ammonium transporter
MPLAALGAFILWFGWFGFNPGSALNGLDSSIAHIVVTTNLSAAAGGLFSALFTLARYGKVDASMTMNGALAGLVAITAGCAYVNTTSAVVIGAVAGILVVIAVEVIDRAHADDPVGAIAVHGVCGSFGTLAVGLFASIGSSKGLFFEGIRTSQSSGTWSRHCFCIGIYNYFCRIQSIKSSCRYKGQ